MSALDIQIGGIHYKTATIQPVQYIEANKLAFLEGCVVKRVTRHDKPTGNGRQDIEKAIHELQLLLELRYPLEPDHADLGDFGQQNMIEPTVKDSLTVGSVGYGVSRYKADMPTWATHVLAQIGKCKSTVYAKLSNGQYLSERGRIYNMHRWAVVSQKFTPEPASEIDDDSPRQQRIHQNGELGREIYAAVHGDGA